MATVRSIGFQSYCDTMYRELSEMRFKLIGFVKDIERMKGPEKELVKSHVAHFVDLIKAIDWKLEILTKVCPFEWAGYKEAERTASVRMDEEFTEKLPIGAGNFGG
jgi:hypothetical protein